jgi:hypothetical protein
MKYMRKTTGYISTDYKSNTETTKELNIIPVLNKNKMKLFATYKQNAPQYTTENSKKLQTNSQEKPGETIISLLGV